MNKPVPEKLIEKVYTTCRGCGHGGCGIFVVKENGRPVRVEGDRSHPVSKGYSCKKAHGSLLLQDHKDRLTHPLKRIGNRGEGKWEQITWDEALTVIAEKFNQIKRESGAEAVCFGHGTGRDFHHYLYRVTNTFGTPNILTPGHMCYLPRIAICKLLGLDVPFVDYDNDPECLLVWGCNHLNSNADEYKAVNMANTLRKAKTVVCIDPRRTKVAEKAHYWLKIRPGTDAALAMGFLNVIINENLYDHHFVEHYTTGFEKLRERVQEFTPSRVSEITWIPESQIIEVARLYATTKPAALQWGVAIEQNVNCVDADRATLYLVALTGNLDVPGGNVIFDHSPVMTVPEFSLAKLMPPEQKAKMLGADKYKLGATIGRLTPHALWDSIQHGTPYKTRALMTFASNILLIRENAHRVYDAIKQLEFFVSVDVFHTPTTQMADIVLPAATWMEHDTVADFWKNHGHSFPRVKIMDPPGEAWSDKKILNELGKKLGLQEYFWNDVDESLDYILEKAGLTWDEFKRSPGLTTPVRFRKYEAEGFRSTSGKLDFYIQQYEDWGYDPLPSFTEPNEGPASSPEFVAKYPLVLTTGQRILNFFGSDHRHSEYLRKSHPDPVADINPDTALRYGIQKDDWIYIESPRGKAKFRANVTEDIIPGVVAAEFAWWFPEKGGPDYGWMESNINFLTDDQGKLDPGMGATTLKGLMCRISKV